MKFKNKVLQNLQKYKIDTLKIKENGQYKYRGNILYLPHILPRKLADKNFIQEVTSTKKLKQENIKLHRYYYHLNSSQVMCINFFEKIRHNPKILKQLIKNTLGIELPEDEIKSLFEYEDEKYKQEGTNFDFYIECGKIKIYWEIKYTEGKFASTTAKEKTHSGESHLVKYNKVYKELFKTTKYLKDLTMDEFFKNYQIYRNISYVKNNNQYSAFLYPQDDIKLDKQIKDVIKKHKCESNVFAIDWKDIYKNLFNIIENNGDYKKYYLEFKEKYLNY